MKQKALKLFIILFVSLLIIPFWPKPSHGCIFEPSSDDYFFSFFAPEIIKNKAESAFFLTADNLYTRSYSEGEIDAPDISTYDYKKENMNEWNDYFKGGLSCNTIELLVYKSEAQDLEHLSSFMHSTTGKTIYNYQWERKDLSQTAIDSLNLEFIKMKATNSELLTSAIDYLSFAKKCEPIVAPTDDYWGLMSTSEDNNIIYAKASLLIPGSEKGFTAAASPFFRLRYAFQLIRLYYFNANYQAGIKFYEDTAASMITESSIKARITGYAAACYYKSKQYARANYLYAMLYSRHPENAASFVWSFHPQEEADWQTSLSYAKNDEEKIALWHMMGVYRDPLRAMQQIYAINPKSDKMDLLLTRAINIEELYLIPANKDTDENYTHYVPLNFDKDKDALPLLSFVKKCVERNELSDPVLWNIAAGYLYYLSGKNSDEAEKYFTAARTYKPSLIQEQQIKVIELLFRVRNLQKILPPDEEMILGDLNWLQYGTMDSDIRKSHTLDHIYIQLADKYAKQNEQLKAELCFHRYDFFDDTQRTQLMYEFMKKPNHTEWEKFLLKGYFASPDDVVEWQATHLMSKKDINGALKKLLEEVHPEKDTLWADPFIIHVKDCHDCDFDSLKRRGITKLAFIKRITELIDLAKTNSSKSADYYFELGNAFYNLTWYGNARHFWESNISDDIHYFKEGPYYADEWIHKHQPSQAFFERDNSAKADTMLNLNCKLAEKYYQLAYEKSPTNEFSAKCCWMLAKCELNDYYDTSGYIKTYTLDRQEIDFKCGPHVKMLKDKYADTQYYQEVIKECGYFRTYLRRN